MKTTIVPLIGNPVEALYQLGLREKEAFLALDKRITRLLSTNFVLQQGQDIISRARFLLKKKEISLFDKCIASYAEGLGIDSLRYQSFLALFELAANGGQVFPELKGILPGCTSVFEKKGLAYTHSRLLDFPMAEIYGEYQRLYLWQEEGKEPLLTMSCEGLAPLFFQGIHGSGISFALHHKPGKKYHLEGQSIFKILFETAFSSLSFVDFKKELKKCISVTKWSILALEKNGQVNIMDIDGPALDLESYNLNDQSPLIFTNIPLKKENDFRVCYLRFCEDRQLWTKEAMSGKTLKHPLDLLTAVDQQKVKNWIPSAATLTTIAAYHINLTEGYLDLKEGQSALTSSDAILRVNLGEKLELKILKEYGPPNLFEKSWKRAAKSQASFDLGKYDEAYHELQMAESLMPHKLWKEIFSFYLCVWDFKFITNNLELAQVYKKVKTLTLPPQLNDQKILMIMRLEKKLDLSPTVSYKDVVKENQDLYQQEKLASRPVFTAWMKLLYPRMEILDIFSPHKR
jgi:hypothetical protein